MVYSAEEIKFIKKIEAKIKSKKINPANILIKPIEDSEIIGPFLMLKKEDEQKFERKGIMFDEQA